MKQHGNEVILTDENIEEYANAAIELDGAVKNGPYFQALVTQANRQSISLITPE